MPYFLQNSRKQNIKDKCSKLQISNAVSKVIFNDIFGSEGLAHASTETDYWKKIEELKQKWDRLEREDTRHVKNAIPFSQFLRLRRLCNDDTDFNSKCEEMCHFFQNSGYPASAVTTGKQGAQEIDRETALQTSLNKETDRIPFTLTYHPQSLAIKNIMLPKLNTYFLYHHSFHSNATKTS